eukprot:m.159589 g.159589  ORF g.159589 m.159589 type:complete len:321 (+) comp31138_c0_seq1:38-1000(+)
MFCATALSLYLLPKWRPIKTRFNGITMPPWFQKESATAFHEDLQTRDNDVFLSSLPKGGTTWMNKILFYLLKGIGDDGVLNELGVKDPGFSGQVYPEAVPSVPGKKTDAFFGPWRFADLMAQKSPRLFSTHLFGGRFLPKQLTDVEHGKGRLVVVLRNLKDTCTSGHFFRGIPQDGWLGNEHGDGTLNRFLEPNSISLDGYGSKFDWIRETDELVTKMEKTNRVCVVYFEQLKESLPQEIDRIADFLGLSLTEKKRAAVIAAVSFSEMKTQKQLITMRKGQIGDWKHYMTQQDWDRLDSVFEAELGDVAIAQPLKKYHKF